MAEESVIRGIQPLPQEDINRLQQVIQAVDENVEAVKEFILAGAATQDQLDDLIRSREQAQRLLRANQNLVNRQ